MYNLTDKRGGYMKKNIQETIENIMITSEKGKIFTNSDFYDVGGKAAVEKALSRLNKEEKIFRILDGYYTIPKYSEIIKEYSYPSPDQLANKIAEKYSWKISPFGETALNLFGFSTQVSAKYEYISDGPYRDYEYRNQIIKFKHTNNKNISIFSKELSLVIQVIKALGKENITTIQYERLASYCAKHVKENLKRDTKHVTEWIYKVLRRIGEMNEDEQIY